MTPRLSLCYNPSQAALHLFGEFDIADRTRLRRRGADLLELQATVVEIDASEVTYVDCGCLAEIARAVARLESNGRLVRVRAVSTAFRRAALSAGYAELVPAAGSRECEPIMTPSTEPAPSRSCDVAPAGEPHSARARATTTRAHEPRPSPGRGHPGSVATSLEWFSSHDQ